MNIEELKKKDAELFDAIVEGRMALPFDTLVFLDEETMSSVITPRRLELIRLISKRNPSSVLALAKLSGRLKQAVDRDLKGLECHGLVDLRREGRKVRPVLKRRYILFSLADTPHHKGGKQRAVAF